MANKPVEIVQLAGDAGKYKANLTPGNYLVRSFMAGLFIAVGGALATICSTGLETSVGPGFKSMISGAVFPVGLIAIVLTGMSLFTGDTMLIPMAVFQKKSTWGKVINAWFWVYIGNFIGFAVLGVSYVRRAVQQGWWGRVDRVWSECCSNRPGENAAVRWQTVVRVCGRLS